MKQITKLAAALALFAASVAPASADIVQNGGFESGYAGWTSNSWGIGNINRGVHSGSYSAYTGCTDPNFSCYLGQTLTTVAGQRYNLSFWLYTDGYVLNGQTYSQFSNGLQVSFGGNVVSTIRDFPTTNTGSDYSPGGPMTQFFINGLLATSSSTYLNFAGYHGPAGIFLDDISVEAANDLPEPGSLALTGLALAGLFAAKRRRAQ